MIHSKDYVMQFLYENAPGRKAGWNYKKQIRGWWKDSLFEVFDAITSTQRKFSVTGNVCEVGTWYGRSFLPLRNFINNNEVMVGADIYVKEQRQEVERNILRCFGTLDQSILISGDSKSEIVKKQIRQHGPYRLFYVDGGHKYEDALNDLRLAGETLTEAGLIFLDDYTNPNFEKDVSGAIRTFLKEDEFMPCFTTALQVFLCRHDFYERYRQMMSSLNWNETRDATFGVINYEHPRGYNSWRR